MKPTFTDALNSEKNYNWDNVNLNVNSEELRRSLFYLLRKGVPDSLRSKVWQKLLDSCGTEDEYKQLKLRYINGDDVLFYPKVNFNSLLFTVWKYF